MTARILAALLLITGGLLLGAILPLGMATTGQEEHDFRTAAVAHAGNVAMAAEENISDTPSVESLTRTIKALRRPGETITVFDVKGRRLAGAGTPDHRIELTRPTTLALAGQSRADLSHRDTTGVMVTAAPIHGHTGVVGAVLLTQPVEHLDRRVRSIWLELALKSAIAVAAAALLAFALARWVGRPLRDLETTAEALGSGRLEVRARTGKGPADVRRLARRFNVMAARLETLIDDHRVVLADVSHQLRTPLAALRLRMELLAADATPDVAEECDSALEELARLSRLVDGVLAVARAEQTTAPPRPVDVRAVLIERTDAWRSVAEERQVELTMSAPFPATVLAGQGHLEQVLDNLIDNALHAVSVAEEGDGGGEEDRDGVGDRGQGAGGSPVPAGGRAHRVTLGAASTADHQVTITVADDGPGMTSQAREQAFRRFRTGRVHGTGLGLAIVHRLVTADGGTVSLSETPGGGLTVTLDMPAA